jgi:broad specificity phosphatase PhoE
MPNTTTTTTKTLYLVRHAESLENVAYGPARRAGEALASFQMPAWKDLWCAVKLPTKMFRQSVMDAAVSELGARQIRQLHRSFARDNISNHNHARLLVAHSPLRRAKQTAFGIVFGPEVMDSEQPPSGQPPCLELESLREVNPTEVLGDILAFWKPKKAIDERIEQFEQWLESREEDAIVVVGHSVYFKRMLDLPKTFDNCDVWELEYSMMGGDGGGKEVQCTIGSSEDEGDIKSKNLPRSWTSIKQLFRYTPEHNPDEE